MNRHMEQNERGFVLAELVVAFMVLAVCSFGMWTMAEQIPENRREREIHLEALMLAQQTLEAMPERSCQEREALKFGRWASFHLSVIRRPITEEWSWCQVTVKWTQGKEDGRDVQLGRLVLAPPKAEEAGIVEHQQVGY